LEKLLITDVLSCELFLGERIIETLNAIEMAGCMGLVLIKEEINTWHTLQSIRNAFISVASTKLPRKPIKQLLIMKPSII
jgi:hypothetical protein